MKKQTYSKLRGKIREVFGTQDKLANEMGISERSLSLKLNGKVAFSKKDILLLSKLLNIPVEEIGYYFF